MLLSSVKLQKKLQCPTIAEVTYILKLADIFF